MVERTFSLEEIAGIKKRVSDEVLGLSEGDQFVNDEGVVDRFRIYKTVECVLGKTINDLPVPCLEFLMWDWLERGKYWDSLSYLGHISQKSPDYDKRLDLIRFSDTIFREIMSGRNVASSVPIYSDVFNCLAGEKSPLKFFVKYDQKRYAVNTGFWSCLKAMGTEDKRRFDGGKELTRITQLDDFFGMFDFAEGVFEAKNVPEFIDFYDFKNISVYLKWLNVQEHQIRHRLGGEDSLPIFGKLAAPLVHELLSENENEHAVKEFYPLARFMIRGNVVDSVPVQRVLEKFFRNDIQCAFEGDEDHCSFARLEMLDRIVKDRDKIIEDAWESALKSPETEYDRIPIELRKYVPKKVVKDYAEGLRKSLGEMKRFDVDLFRKFLDEGVAGSFPVSTYGRLRNQALEVYFSGSPRPKTEDLKSLHYGLNMDPKEVPIVNKTKAFLTLDFLAKSRWQEANNILHSYDVCGYYPNGGRGVPGKPAVQFVTGAENYVGKHGKVKMSKDGLNPHVCYPKHNNIPDFVKRNEKLFERLE